MRKLSARNPSECGLCAYTVAVFWAFHDLPETRPPAEDDSFTEFCARAASSTAFVDVILNEEPLVESRDVILVAKVAERIGRSSLRGIAGPRPRRYQDPGD